MKIQVSKDIEIDLTELFTSVHLKLIEERVSFDVKNNKIIFSIKRKDCLEGDDFWRHYRIIDGEIKEI